MGNTYILEISKVKNLTILSNKAIHNFRQIPTAAPNADYNRTHLNTTLVNPGIEDYGQLWKDRQYNVNIMGGQCKPRQGAVYAYEIVLGYTHEAIKEENLRAWCDANIEWLSETFGGRENVLSAILHMDEYTPHIHAIVIPIDNRQRLCARSFTGGRQKMNELRESYTIKMSPFGLNAPQKYTKADNKGLKKFYRAVDSIVHTEAPLRMEGELEEDYIDRCEEWVKTIEFQALSKVNEAEKKVKDLYAKQEEYNLENKYVSHLNNLLILKYCGNKKRAKNIILQFTEFIDNVPINTLEQTMIFLKDKFIKDENVLAMNNTQLLENINNNDRNHINTSTNNIQNY